MEGALYSKHKVEPSVRQNEKRDGSGDGPDRDTNRLDPADRAAHGWYRFVLSFPPHLVRGCLKDFGITRSELVLDPFCGTGTTLVECKKLGIPGVGIEANPMAHFASTVKADWSPDPKGLLEHACRVAEVAAAHLRLDGIEDEALPLFRTSEAAPEPQIKCRLRTLPRESEDLLLANSISPLPLHKALVLLDNLNRHSDERYVRHELLALAKALVYTASNLHFGPEVGIGRTKEDAPVLASWIAGVRTMAQDLGVLQSLGQTPTQAFLGDSRDLGRVLEPSSIDGVITSPPYPNEKDYTRTTRLESVLLGFIRSKADLQELKRRLLRSNTRGVYKKDDDDQWVSQHAQIQEIAEAIETRRVRMGKTSGFEKLYGRVTRLYFGGMARHLANLRPFLRPGARLAYVVGDQASYLRVMIRTGHLLADIAVALGYKVLTIKLFRTRLATATREQLREEVVFLHWPGKAPGTS